MPISNLAFTSMSMAVDRDGFVHVAAAMSESSGRGIWYLSNLGGAWTSVEVAMPTGVYDAAFVEPSLAIDGDGSVWIAFTRQSCPPQRCESREIAYVTNATGQWSEPVIVDGPDFVQPTLVVRGGVVHLAYLQDCYLAWSQDDCQAPVHYGTTQGGSWASRQMPFESSDRVVLGVDASGAAAILAVMYGQPPVTLLAAFEASDFAPEQVWQKSYDHPALLWPLLIDHDVAGTPVAVWGCYCDEPGPNVYWATGSATSWSKATTVLRDVWAASAVRAGDGTIGLVGQTGQMGSESGSYFYADDAAGSFHSRTLAPDVGFGPGFSVGVPGSMGLAFDPAGRPHIVYITYGSKDGGSVQPVGLWYVTGPAPER